LLAKPHKSEHEDEISRDIESQVKPVKKGVAAKEKDDTNTWGNSDTVKNYGVLYTLGYIIPILWKGD
jgi:Leu/Phe-tRNA-protein transferase